MIVTTLVTGEDAFRDVQTLLFTLDQYHRNVSLYIYTDSDTAPKMNTLKTNVHLHILPHLDKYMGLSRKDMEAKSGVLYPSLFHDYTIEKANLLSYVLKEHPEGAWFLDADICLFSALPAIPEGKKLALSPHMIRVGDERRFGTYNAGMIWVCDPSLLETWKGATHASRFYEQAALEDLATAVAPEELFVLPIQHNFGWWRLDQSADPPPVIQKRLGYKRGPGNVGLAFDGEVLCSIHTHWKDNIPFNQWIRGALELVARSHPPAKQFLGHLKRVYSNSSTQVRI
jgi:hypothetical protein